MDNKKLLGKKIQQIRKLKGLTQEQLAELINMEPNSISVIESGRNFPTLNTLEKISNILNINLCDFFTYDCNLSLDEMKNFIHEQVDLMEEKCIVKLFKYIKVNLVR